MGANHEEPIKAKPALILSGAPRAGFDSFTGGEGAPDAGSR